jgi:hypothetical protein
LFTTVRRYEKLAADYVGGEMMKRLMILATLVSCGGDFDPFDPHTEVPCARESRFTCELACEQYPFESAPPRPDETACPATNPVVGELECPRRGILILEDGASIYGCCLPTAPDEVRFFECDP